jgi:hypothetical protein
MKTDIQHGMKHVVLFFILILLVLNTASGQSPSGLLKIFSDNPLVVYVDDVHYPQYGEIKLVPGTHYVKAINSEGVRVYSEIVSVKDGEVTAVLVEAQEAGVPSTHTGVTYGQTSVTSRTDLSAGNSDAVPEPTLPPAQTIDIGQIGGKLPRDMSGAFGLGFGMSVRDVDQIMSPKAAQAQRNTGYYVYAIPNGSSVYMVECRFMDQKLFQIIVGYVSTSNNNSKLKLDKKEVPFPEYNGMLNDLTAIYGEPDSTEKIFLSGYSEEDGRILEALKRGKALIIHNWTDEETGNNIIMGLGYTTAPLAATIYTSGPMSAEAAARKLRLHSYDYNKSFKDNYFSN